MSPSAQNGVQTGDYDTVKPVAGPFVGRISFPPDRYQIEDMLGRLERIEKLLRLMGVEPDRADTYRPAEPFGVYCGPIKDPPA